MGFHLQGGWVFTDMVWVLEGLKSNVNINFDYPETLKRGTGLGMVARDYHGAITDRFR